MTTDITFCISHLCPVGDSCRRYITETEEWHFIKEHKFTSFGLFEPEKGRDCIGYKHKAKLTLNPLEDKSKRRGEGMKHIKGISFCPIIQNGSEGWQNRVIVCFEMVDLWVREKEQVQEVSWVEFNSDTEELQFIIDKLQLVLDKTKAAYSKTIEEVQP